MSQSWIEFWNWITLTCRSERVRGGDWGSWCYREHWWWCRGLTVCHHCPPAHSPHLTGLLYLLWWGRPAHSYHDCSLHALQTRNVIGQYSTCSVNTELWLVNIYLTVVWDWRTQEWGQWAGWDQGQCSSWRPLESGHHQPCWAETAQSVDHLLHSILAHTSPGHVHHQQLTRDSREEDEEHPGAPRGTHRVCNHELSLVNTLFYDTNLWLVSISPGLLPHLIAGPAQHLPLPSLLTHCVVHEAHHGLGVGDLKAALAAVVLPPSHRSIFI